MTKIHSCPRMASNDATAALLEPIYKFTHMSDVVLSAISKRYWKLLPYQL